jgi:hypothetical protein
MLTRMSLTWIGDAGTPEQVANTFGTVVLIFVLYLLVGWWLPFVGLIFLIYSLVYGTRLRMAFRKKYDIETSCCGEHECMDDCYFTFWCAMKTCTRTSVAPPMGSSRVRQRLSKTDWMVTLIVKCWYWPEECTAWPFVLVKRVK